MANRHRAYDRINFGQLNMQNGRSVGGELRQLSVELSLDVLLLQEPYTIGGRVRGLGLRTPVLGDQQPEDARPWSAIAVPTELITPMELLQFRTSHFTVAQFDTEIGRLYCISAYFQPSHGINPYLDHLERILLKLRGSHIIIGMDANAKSALWYSDQTDDRGESLEQLIEAHGLVILNTEGQPATHVNNYWGQFGQGETNIDVSLATPRLAGRIADWQVRENYISSDHRLITWSVAINIRDQSKRTENYAIRRAKWPIVVGATNQKLTQYEDLFNMDGNAEEKAVAFSQCVKQGCERGIPKRTIVPNAVPWWNDRISAARKQLKAARRRMQRCCPCDHRIYLHGVFRAKRRQYQRLIKTSKHQSWLAFVAQMGNNNPWGIIYKMGADKLKIAQILTSLKANPNAGNQWTGSIEETLGLLLDTLMPPDSAEGENPQHAQVRRTARERAGIGIEAPFSMRELQEAVKLTKPNKSPGPDRIPPEVIRKWGNQTKVKFLNTVNTCWSQGHFPACWKVSNIKILRKAGDRDWSDPSNYRPISLLPVMGKVFERLIAGRLLQGLHGKLSDRQYGFTAGRSTVDAIQTVMDFVQHPTSKYTVGLFLDIKGAFDGVWWPMVIDKLIRLEVSDSLVRIIRSYLNERKVTLSSGESSVTREVTKGCPQGSVLGPILWNLVFDDLLRAPLPDGTEMVAYADDALVLVRANSRNEVETKFRVIAGELERWASLAKLQYSVSKTKIMVFGKNQFHRERPPVVRLNGERVGITQTFMYLGLKLDDKLSFLEHAKYTGEKAKLLFSKILRLARLKYGLKPQTLSTIYDGVYIPIITYGARIWAHRANNSRVKRVLRSSQRHVLLGLTGAYRTSPYDAVMVAAGKTPIDLLVRESRTLWEAKQGLIALPKREIKLHTIAEWQREWDGSDTGRHAYAIFPNIMERLEQTWLKPDHIVMQYITGHGAFNSYLHRFNLSDSPLCVCGHTEDTPEHVIFECGALVQERSVLLGEPHWELHDWPGTLRTFILSQNGYLVWKEFVNIAHGRREV